MHKTFRTFLLPPALMLALVWLMACMTGTVQVESTAPVHEAFAPVAERSPDAILRQLIMEQGLTGDPSLGRDLPTIDEPIARLGKLLFFSKALGGEFDSACVSCHLPTLGGGDDLPLSIGVGALDPDLLGPGRLHPHGPLVPRNAPTTFNIGLWDQVLFHDGRLESIGKTPGMNGADGLGIRTPEMPLGVADPLAGPNLAAAQARFPVTSVAEMRGASFLPGVDNQYVREHLAGRLGHYGAGAAELAKTDWLPLFEAVFGPRDRVEDLVMEQYVAEALGAYMRSQTFVDTPWRAYVQGDMTALDEVAKRGAILFFRDIDEGGAGCASCHGGDFFTDEQFYVLAVPQFGPGKGDGATRTDDYGRFRETRRLADLYAFRTPTLLNVAETGPYGHTGAYATLEGIIRHHLDPAAAVAAYDWDALDPQIFADYGPANTAKALQQLLANRQAGLPSIQPVMLEDAQVQDLVAFMHSLTDPCITDPLCLAPWMPGPTDPDPDNSRLEARVLP